MLGGSVNGESHLAIDTRKAFFRRVMIKLLSESVEEVHWGADRGSSMCKGPGVGREACYI